MTSEREVKEVEERLARGEQLMTTSCCPAYTRAVHLYAEPLVPCISGTGTPMHYTAMLAKKADPDCLTVFIGPCVAKMHEGMEDEKVDYVLSVAELIAIFKAKDIDATKMEPAKLDYEAPSSSARKYAHSGGVADAIRQGMKHPETLRAAVINGLDKAGIKQLIRYGQIQAGSLKPQPDEANLVEVMACEGGCIGGPMVVANPKTAEIQLGKYAGTAT
jgi:iron only hydrogenase large subunit-like protein